MSKANYGKKPASVGHLHPSDIATKDRSGHIVWSCWCDLCYQTVELSSDELNARPDGRKHRGCSGSPFP